MSQAPGKAARTVCHRSAAGRARGLTHGPSLRRGRAGGLRDHPDMRNGEIAEAFEELASLYELDGAVVYRVVAYRNAAKAIREAGGSVAELAKQGRAAELA